MQPKNFYFGGGSAETVLHPLVAAALIIGAILILVLPRKYVSVPFLLCIFLIPMSQTLVISGLHLFVFRIIVLFGCVRLAFTKLLSSKSGILGSGFSTIDKIFILWAIFRASAFLILFSFQTGAIVNQFGFLWDALGGYFVLRFLIHDDEDIQRTIKIFGVIAIIVAACMLNEKINHQNIFGFLGGFKLVPEIRDGTVRAQGPFAHPLLAGTFGGTLLVLFVWLWQGPGSKVLSILAVAAATAMVLTASSSTPMMAYAGGLIGLSFWPLRKKMRLFRWGLVFTLIGLQLVMKAPVWFLIARVGMVGASSGYHRAMLVDQFIKHFSDWWLIGTNANDSYGFDMWDLSNQFVAEGEIGGLATFISFVALISVSFGRIGSARKRVEGDPKREWFQWVLGSALFAHVAAFFGISYFDQTRFLWYAVLAIIIASTAPILAKQDATENPADWVPDREHLSYASFPALDNQGGSRHFGLPIRGVNSLKDVSSNDRACRDLQLGRKL